MAEEKKEKVDVSKKAQEIIDTIEGLVKNVLVYQSIRTTRTKAMAVKSVLEKLISLAKKNTLAAKRQAYKSLNDHRLVNLLFNEIGPRFTSRSGGYTRVLHLGNRRGDDAAMAVLELTEIKKKEIRKDKKAKEEKKPEITKGSAPEEKKPEEKKTKPETKILEKPTATQRPPKKFLGGIRSIFKKKSDSL